MAIITFMSDFGFQDPYVAAVKAKILSLNPTQKVIDISHQITPFDINHAAYVLRNVYKDFPNASVHLVSISKQVSGESMRYLAVKMDEHYFIGPDNGIFTLISEKAPTAVIEITRDNYFSPVFPEKSTLAHVAVSLANGVSIYNFGKQITDIRTQLQLLPRYTDQSIQGHVIHVDNFGNAITNITREMFEAIRKDQSYQINFSRESVQELSLSYNSVPEGELLVLFNTNGLLEIAICEGHASHLLGLPPGSPVSILFQ